MTHSVAEQLTARRDKKRLSVPEVARRARLAPVTVYRAEQGLPVSVPNLIKIADVLGCEVRLIGIRSPQVANKLKATSEEAA